MATTPSGWCGQPPKNPRDARGGFDVDIETLTIRQAGRGKRRVHRSATYHRNAGLGAQNNRWQVANLEPAATTTS
jgi:hypothetical protein